jgi:hypothetical protein
MGQLRINTEIQSGYLKGRERGRPWCKWEDNIRMDLREIGWEGVDWMHLSQVRD